MQAKPNGSVRIILNLSSPEGLSVNEGIDEKDFPATMSSTLKWIRVLNRAGRNCRMTKVDWSDAYKHLAVRVEDLNLQWFSWLGMAFCELCLIFGSKSSVGLYDRLAKQVLAIVCAKSRMPSYMVCQHLDDCVAAAPEDSELIYSFDNCYYEVADQHPQPCWHSRRHLRVRPAVVSRLAHARPTRTCNRPAAMD